MNKKHFLKAVLDGFIQSLVLVCLGVFVISTYTSNLSLRQHILIGILGAILSSIVYFVLTMKESNNKAIMCYSLLSIIFFALCIIIILAFRLTFTFDFGFLRETNNSDGILLLFAIGSFILASIMLRLCIFASLVIKNIHQAKQRK